MRLLPAIGLVAAILLMAGGSACGQFTTIDNVEAWAWYPTIPAGTQVNILPGGELVGLYTTTYVTGGELNVLGGRVNTPVTVQGDSTFNMSSGEVLKTFILEGDSRGQISGGSTASLTTRGAGEVSMSGGQSGPLFIHDQSHLSLSGGAIVGWVNLTHDGRFTMHGGMTDNLWLLHQSAATVMGGYIGGHVRVGDDSQLILRGGDFRIDGDLPAGLPQPDGSVVWDAQPGSVITGRLADGTAFGYALEGSPSQPQGTVRFEPVDLPALPAEINVPSDPAPPSIGSGQVLNLSHGGALPANFVAGWGSQLNMSGGEIGKDLRSYGASVNITDGTIASTFEASLGSQVNIAGGKLSTLRLTRESQADISQATLSSVYVLDQSQAEIRNSTLSSFRAEGGSHATLSGVRASHIDASTSGTVAIESGLITGRVTAHDTGSIKVAGGIYTSVLDANPGGSLRIVGDKFAIDGVPVTDLDNVGDSLQVDLGNRILTGILADGTPVVAGGFNIAPGSLTLERSVLPDIDPGEIVLPGPSAPTSIRSGQQLTVGPGGEVGPHFRSGDGAKVLVGGGSIGTRYQASGTEITLRAGAVGSGFGAYNQSVVKVEGGSIGQAYIYNSHLEMTGGAIGSLSQLNGRSTATIHAGTLGDHFRVSSGSALIYGGDFGNYFAVGTSPFVGPRGTEGEPEGVLLGTTVLATADIYGGNFTGFVGIGVDGEAHIYGGTFGQFQVSDGGTLTLYGTHFTLPPPTGDGPEIDLMSLLEPNVPYLLDARNTTLTATLADGSPFDLELSTMAIIGRDYVPSNASVYLVLVQVPEPANLALILLPLAALAGHHIRRTAQRFC